MFVMVRLQLTILNGVMVKIFEIKDCRGIFSFYLFVRRFWPFGFLVASFLGGFVVAVSPGFLASRCRR